MNNPNEPNNEKPKGNMIQNENREDDPLLDKEVSESNHSNLTDNKKETEIPTAQEQNHDTVK